MTVLYREQYVHIDIKIDTRSDDCLTEKLLNTYNYITIYIITFLPYHCVSFERDYLKETQNIFSHCTRLCMH